MPNDDSATPLPDGSSGKAPTTTEWAGVHRMKGLLSPPTLTPAFKVEISIHKPPRMLRRDIELVFRPDLTAAHAREAAEGQSLDEYLAERLIAVPTWQPSKQDLSEMSFVVNEERRGLLLNFHAWVKAVRARLGDWWSDASDPLEGTALFGSRTSCIYNELEGLTSLLRYGSCSSVGVGAGVAQGPHLVAAVRPQQRLPNFYCLVNYSLPPPTYSWLLPGTTRSPSAVVASCYTPPGSGEPTQ